MKRAGEKLPLEWEMKQERHEHAREITRKEAETKDMDEREVKGQVGAKL